jgi:hypothetical protein
MDRRLRRHPTPPPILGIQGILGILLNLGIRLNRGILVNLVNLGTLVNLLNLGTLRPPRRSCRPMLRRAHPAAAPVRLPSLVPRRCGLLVPRFVKPS